jgi:magnesium chelatase family protein
LLDRIDIRVPVKPAGPVELASGPGEPSSSIRSRVRKAREIQADRFSDTACKVNGRLTVSGIERFCALGDQARIAFVIKAEREGFSSRACHSTLKVARTIADLEGASNIEVRHLDEAFSLRKYGDDDVFWLIP